MTVFHLLAAYGMCFALMNDKAVFLTDRFRGLPNGLGPIFGRMLECAYCTGFHCGWLTCLMAGQADRLFDPILWAFAASVFCYGADAWVRWLEIRSDFSSGS